MGQLTLGDRYVYYEHTGGEARRPTVLLSHGWALSCRVWDDLTSKLSDEGFGVVAYDHRNCGQSSKDFPDVAIGSLGDDIVAICDRLDLDRVVLNGWSLGGAVAVDAASKLGGRLVGLIVTGGATPRYTQAAGFPHGGQPADVEATVAALRADRVNFLRPLYCEGVFTAPVSEATKAWVHSIALQASPAADASLGALANLGPLGTWESNPDASPIHAVDDTDACGVTVGDENANREWVWHIGTAFNSGSLGEESGTKLTIMGYISLCPPSAGKVCFRSP